MTGHTQNVGKELCSEGDVGLSVCVFLSVTHKHTLKHTDTHNMCVIVAIHRPVMWPCSVNKTFNYRDQKAAVTG